MSKLSVFHTKNVKTKVLHNITKKLREGLKDIKTSQNCCARVQCKGFRFVVVSNDEYCEKVNTQRDRSLFTQLRHNSSENKGSNFIKKWEDLKILVKKWFNYTKSNDCKPGTMCELIKNNNPVRVITSACGITNGYLSRFVENLIK